MRAACQEAPGEEVAQEQGVEGKRRGRKEQRERAFRGADRTDKEQGEWGCRGLMV